MLSDNPTSTNNDGRCAIMSGRDCAVAENKCFDGSKCVAKTGVLIGKCQCIDENETPNESGECVRIQKCDDGATCRKYIQ